VYARTSARIKSLDDSSWKRLKANMIASPASMLDGRTFDAATGAARAGQEFVAGSVDSFAYQARTAASSRSWQR
jgi:hypothetical protein